MAAAVAGACSFAAIGEWAGRLDRDQLTRLRLTAAPEESTLRKLFGRLNADLWDRVIGAALWTRTAWVDRRRVTAIDGKTVRGGRPLHRAALHLVAALDQQAGTVLGQIAVTAKSNEILPRNSCWACST